MSVSKNQRPLREGADFSDGRVTTVISCPGVRPMARADLKAETRGGANENNWFDAKGVRRHWYANIAALGLASLLLFGGVWLVTEFVRLQKMEACYEAGRRDCAPLDMNRRHKPAPQA